jgi:predicted aspartyl protease
VPIVHTRLKPRPNKSSSKKTRSTPRTALRDDGPYIQVRIGVAEPIATELKKQGKPVPKPLKGYALIDTGASNTCISEKAAKELKLTPVDVISMMSAFHRSVERKVYPIHIEVIGLSIGIDVLRAIGANLDAHNLDLLIGRDVLENFAFFYNGPAGELTVAL